MPRSQKRKCQYNSNLKKKKYYDNLIKLKHLFDTCPCSLGKGLTHAKGYFSKKL